MRDDIAKIVESFEAHFVGFKISGGKRTRNIEVYADTEQGITADTLAKISRALSDWLENSDAIESDFRLMVSSPGLDTPLEHCWQYIRHHGKRVRIKYGTGEDTTTIEGRIDACDGDTVAVQLKNERLEIPLKEIERAVVVPSL